MRMVINKETDRFFISINKKKYHTFLMFGIYEGNQVKRLLCRVGKIKALSEPNNRSFYDRTCNGRKMELADEGISRPELNQTPISYQAYEITFKQYCEFVRFLEAIQVEENRASDNLFACFKPVSEEGNHVHLQLTERIVFEPRRENLGDLAAETRVLSLRNTCRHTAIRLVEETQEMPLSSSSTLVSSLFLRDLPYTTQLEYGRLSPNIPFYVLPISPVAYPQLEDGTRKVLEQVYHRMEQMLLLDPHSLQTQRKFGHLKDLYNKILGSQQELGLDDVLLSIQTWKTEHQSDLSVLRKTYFWDSFFTRKSATMKLIDRIESDLQSASGMECC